MSEVSVGVSRGSRLLSQMTASRNNKSNKDPSLRMPSRLTCGKSKLTQDEKLSSTVQMIELELPNLKVDESRVSPQRVKVLSREYDSDNEELTMEKDEEELRVAENNS